MTPSRPQVFLVGGWRRWLMPVIFGSFALFGLLLLFADDPNTKTAGIVLAVFMLAIAAGGEWLVRRTRLEIGPEGVTLRQVGSRLDTPWSNVADFYGAWMRQGFVLREPMSGKGADQFAFASGLTMHGAPVYDEVQRELLAARRFIPIEGFAWHMKHGRLVDAVVAYAPGLEPALRNHTSAAPAGTQAAAHPRRPMSRAQTMGFIALLAVLILGPIWLALADPPWAPRAVSTALAVGLTLLTLRGALSTVTAWRQRRWGYLVLFFLQTVLCAILLLAVFGQLVGRK